MHAAVVELDALADAVGPGAEDHDRLALAAAHLVARRAPLPAGVVVGRARGELGGAGVDRAERALAGERRVGVERERLQLAQEPRVDARALVHRLDARAPAQQLEQRLVAVGGRASARLSSSSLVGDVGQRRRLVELARAQRLGERLLEGAPDRHRLADGLHVRGQRRVGAGELLEGEARPLDDDVVDRRLEARGRDAGDVVVDLIQAVADGQARGDLGDREAGRLGGERRGARDARVHLDHEDLLGVGVDGELHVGAAGLDADGADHGDRLVAQLLVEVVGERLLRRDRDRVAGVHAHRVDVLDRADDHDVVGAVAHHLELELAPADDRLVEQHLADRRGLEAGGDDPLELLARCARCRRRARRA